VVKTLPSFDLKSEIIVVIHNKRSNYETEYKSVLLSLIEILL